MSQQKIVEKILANFKLIQEINDPAASCGVLGYQRTQQAAGNGPVEIHSRENHG